MTRVDIPSRRPHLVFEFDGDPTRFGGPRFTASLGWASDRAMRAGLDPVECFLSCSSHVSTDVDALARDAAILISLALQFGCTFETMRAAITRLEPASPSDRGAPATLVGRLLDEIERVTAEEAMELSR